jgi:hypothetical protein
MVEFFQNELFLVYYFSYVLSFEHAYCSGVN